MQGQSLQYEMVCSSKTGLVRDRNEDNFCFFGKVMPQEHQSLDGLCSSQGACAGNPLVGVFDGMGGHALGELASFAAAEALSGIASGEHVESWTDADLVQALLDLNDAVVAAGEGANATGSGTTGTLLALGPAELHVANIGDSPAFLFREGQMRELTVRHTDEALRQSLNMPARTPRLTQHLGIPASDFVLEPHVASERIQNGDVVLLCTDGLTDMVDEGTIYQAVGDGRDVRRSYALLRDAALTAGGKDNFTILLCRLSA